VKRLSYDDYRDIRFRPERALWHGEHLAFEVMFFHEGFSFTEPVAFHEVTDQGVRDIPFDPADFDYGHNTIDKASLGGLGFAGFRVHFPLNRRDYRDEVLVFLGASYFRAVGRRQAYGLSGRCLAIDTGAATPEEFPEIVALHLVTPDPEDRAVHVVAEVRSARAEAAFAFRATPGDVTTLEVDAAVFLRAPVEVLGLAPFSSMFLFGEETPSRWGDFRPEVHDSDALLLESASGERILRPLRNPDRTTVSAFRLDRPRGFGLVQRDRRFGSYQDLEARYEARPSAWVEPRGDWGRGAVRLLEIATRREVDDNVAVYFAPDEPGRELRVGYTVSFGLDVPRPGPGARVVGFRSGTPGAGVRPATDGSRLFVVDWAGDALRGLERLDVRVDASGGVVEQVRSERLPEEASWRTVLRVRPQAASVELRAFLYRGSDALGETLAYLWQPGQEGSL
jgi:glucans biosynthesis protein